MEDLTIMLSILSNSFTALTLLSRAEAIAASGLLAYGVACLVLLRLLERKAPLTSATTPSDPTFQKAA